eukprot:6204158-Pleurochrysis_carterae.AAC.1
MQQQDHCLTVFFTKHKTPQLHECDMDYKPDTRFTDNASKCNGAVLAHGKGFTVVSARYDQHQAVSAWGKLNPHQSAGHFTAHLPHSQLQQARPLSPFRPHPQHPQHRKLRTQTRHGKGSPFSGQADA